jgi:hypothetical protein
MRPKNMDNQATAARMVLIVDDDLVFVCWLGDLFKEAGCRTLPGFSRGEAATVTKYMGVEPDIIMLNPSLTGASDLLQHYLEAKPHSKTVTIGPASMELGASFHIHATLGRPSPSEPVLRETWLETIRTLLKQAEVAGAG